MSGSSWARWRSLELLGGVRLREDALDVGAHDVDLARRQHLREAAVGAPLGRLLEEVVLTEVLVDEGALADVLGRRRGGRRLAVALLDDGAELAEVLRQGRGEPDDLAHLPGQLVGRRRLDVAAGRRPRDGAAARRSGRRGGPAATRDSGRRGRRGGARRGRCCRGGPRSRRCRARSSPGRCAAPAGCAGRGGSGRRVSRVAGADQPAVVDPASAVVGRGGELLGVDRLLRLAHAAVEPVGRDGALGVLRERENRGRTHRALVLRSNAQVGSSSHAPTTSSRVRASCPDGSSTTLPPGSSTDEPTAREARARAVR